MVSVLVVVVLFSLTACAQDANGAVRVVSVTDGDTIRVRIQGREEPLRLIGINTPELRPRPETHAEKAYGYAQKLLRQRRVWLEFDRVERDRHGRLLAYVWLTPPDGARDPRVDMLNARLLLAGWAEVMAVSPNDRYRVLFAELQGEAKAAERGMWRRVGGRRNY